MDDALISYALANGVDVGEKLLQAKRIYDLPFDPENRYMACAYKVNGSTYHFSKGDPAVLLARCSYYLTSGGETRSTDAE